MFIEVLEGLAKVVFGYGSVFLVFFFGMVEFSSSLSFSGDGGYDGYSFLILVWLS